MLRHGGFLGVRAAVPAELGPNDEAGQREAYPTRLFPNSQGRIKLKRDVASRGGPLSGYLRPVGALGA